MATPASQTNSVASQHHHPNEITFFDTETTIPSRKGQKYELLEFAAIVVAAQGFYVLESYSTLIRPKTADSITQRSITCNGLTPESVAAAPDFVDVADCIYKLLNGRIWAGHNIAAFDIVRIKEAFCDIGRQMPHCAGVIDTLPLLRSTFGHRAGNLKMATLANYCGLGQQEHRSLADVQLNLDVLKHCSTILFLEANFPTIFPVAEAATTSPLILRSSDKWVISDKEVQNAKSGNNLFVIRDAVRLEGSYQSRVFLNQANNSYPSEKATASSGYIDVSDHTPQACEPVKNMVEEHTDFRIPLRSTIHKGEDSGAFDFSALSSNLESTCNVKEASEEETGVKLNDIFSNVLSTQENMSWKKRNLKAESTSVPSRNSKAKLISGGRPRFVEALHPLSTKDTSSSCCSMACSESIMGISEANGTCMGDISSTEHNELFSRGNDNQVRYDSLCMASRGSQNHVGSDSLCKAASETCNDIAESSDNLQADSDAFLHEDEAEPNQSHVRFENFLSASWICLEALEVKKEPGPWRKPKLGLYHKGLPLKIREINIKVRFSINPLYAFDNNGKARFSIMIEPSTAACEVINKCDDLVKIFIASDGENTTWRPTLMMEEGGVFGARLSIGTRGLGASATYTTEFYRQYASGVEKLVMDAVDSETMRTLLSRGSVIDVAFDLQVYNFNGYSGIRFVADHFLLR